MFCHRQKIIFFLTNCTQKYKMIGNKYSNLLNSKLKENIEVRNIQEGWKEISSNNLITMYSTSYKGHQVQLNKFEGIVPVNFEKAAQFYFENLDDQKKNRDICEQFFKIENVDENTFVAYYQSKGNQIVSSRYVIGVQHRIKLNDNEYLITRDSIDEHPNSPKTDAIQADQIISATFLKKVSQFTTKLEIYSLFDPKINLPTTSSNFINQKKLESINKDLDIIKQM
ncbi:START domain protein (macronuclear) [Tetrahymena thermophila SB210]|uniref:START domain protein n=1 Tax=Tetrahymena thermophila (strain SB210) TaxID=312017 RepID=A4VCR8_TETTS|nr:START domain protein [Tetrahymena thermophila SB210]EDK31322.2 START domain protein [Tetrahymena thermophila SB210]|eukprot:XP_001471057.2 START domain protein [Tetrahymena thermophila SB210]